MLLEWFEDYPLMFLVKLNLENIHLNDTIGSKLIKALSDCPEIQHLVLNKNELSTKTAKELAKQIG